MNTKRIAILLTAIVLALAPLSALADYAFETVTARLHPGAVILLHAVSPDNSAALGRIIDYARQQGYTFKSLRDYDN